MKKIIKWEHWQDPLGGEVEYGELEREDEEEEQEGEGVITSVRPVIPTVAGLIPINAYGSLKTAFNWWMMHTNFNLSESVVDILKRVDGVETLDVVSRYRARVGFGKCFESVDVKKSIQDVLLGPEPSVSRAPLPLNSELKDRVDLLESQARELYKHWAIYVVPNGEIVFVHSDTESEHDKAVELMRQSQELAGGVVRTSHD